MRERKKEEEKTHVMKIKAEIGKKERDKKGTTVGREDNILRDRL